MITSQTNEFEEKDSGNVYLIKCILILHQNFLDWTLLEILQLTININKYNPLKALFCLPLPKEVKMHKGVLNITNLDKKCFMWSILAHLHPINVNAEKVTNYLPYLDNLILVFLTFQ